MASVLEFPLPENREDLMPLEGVVVFSSAGADGEEHLEYATMGNLSDAQLIGLLTLALDRIRDLARRKWVDDSGS